MNDCNEWTIPFYLQTYYSLQNRTIPLLKNIITCCACIINIIENPWVIMQTYHNLSWFDFWCVCVCLCLCVCGVCACVCVCVCVCVCQWMCAKCIVCNHVHGCVQCVCVCGCGPCVCGHCSPVLVVKKDYNNVTLPH